MNADAAAHPAPLRFGDYSALIGYGHHGRHEPIQDFFCTACHRTPALAGGAREFIARRHIALYQLKASSRRVAQALQAIADGLSTRSAARVFSSSETTLQRWLARAGQHSHNLYERCLHSLHLVHVQLDELRLKLHGASEMIRLPLALRLPAGQTTGWIGCDAGSKLIPAFTLGARTQLLVHQLVHDGAKRLAPDSLPVFSSDGLALDF